jgi:hypothetical protein
MSSWSSQRVSPSWVDESNKYKNGTTSSTENLDLSSREAMMERFDINRGGFNECRSKESSNSFVKAVHSHTPNRPKWGVENRNDQFKKGLLLDDRATRRGRGGPAKRPVVQAKNPPRDACHHSTTTRPVARNLPYHKAGLLQSSVLPP